MQTLPLLIPSVNIALLIVWEAVLASDQKVNRNKKGITVSGAWPGGERTSQDVKIWQSNEYSEHLTVGVGEGSRLGAGSKIGTVRGAGDPRSEIGLHVTLVQRSEYAGYVNRVRTGQYSPIGIFMSAVNDRRSPVRCP